LAASDYDLFGVGFLEAGGVDAFVDTLAALAFPGRDLVIAFSKFAFALTALSSAFLKRDYIPDALAATLGATLGLRCFL
jgi:hypothetical protein